LACCVLQNIYLHDADVDGTWERIEENEEYEFKIEGIEESHYNHKLSTQESRESGKAMRKLVFDQFMFNRL
jgi:hypothetical protein